jgi:hypothetical protein
LLTGRRSGGRSSLAAKGIARAWRGSAATTVCCGDHAVRAISSISA